MSSEQSIKISNNNTLLAENVKRKTQTEQDGLESFLLILNIELILFAVFETPIFTLMIEHKFSLFAYFNTGGFIGNAFMGMGIGYLQIPAFIYIVVL
jgi:hypothetical protein